MVDLRGYGRVGFALAFVAGACGDNIAPPPELPVLYEGNVWGGNLAVADGEVYFTTFYHGGELDQAVWGVSVDGGEPRLLWHGAAHALFGRAMAVDAGDVFFDQEDLSDGDDRMKVFSVPRAGGDRRDWGFAGGSGGLAVDDRWVLVATRDGLVRTPRGGGEAQLLVMGAVTDVERRSDEVYITRADRLERVDEDTGAVTPIAGVAGIGLLALADAAAYAIAGDVVWRIPLPPTTAAPTAILAGHGSPYEIAADGDDLYAVVASATDGYRLLRVSVASGAVADITPPTFRAAKVVVTPEAVFAAFCCGERGGTGGGQVLRVER